MPDNATNSNADDGVIEPQLKIDEAEVDNVDAEVNSQNPGSGAAQQSGGSGKEHAKVGFKTNEQAKNSAPPTKQPKQHPDNLEAERRMRAEIPANMAELRIQVQAEIGKYMDFIKQQPGSSVSNVRLVRSVVRKVENAIAKKNNGEDFLSELPSHAEVLAIRYCSPTGHTIHEKVAGGLAYLGKVGLLSMSSYNSIATPEGSLEQSGDSLERLEDSLRQFDDSFGQFVDSYRQKNEKQAAFIASLRETKDLVTEVIGDLEKLVDDLSRQTPGQTSQGERQNPQVDIRVAAAAPTLSAEAGSASEGTRKRPGSPTNTLSKRAKSATSKKGTSSVPKFSG